jgi:hypothetical protein
MREEHLPLDVVAHIRVLAVANDAHDLDRGWRLARLAEERLGCVPQRPQVSSGRRRRG